MGEIKELKNYLDDLDNLVDTGYFKKESIQVCTFYHKDMNLKGVYSEG